MGVVGAAKETARLVRTFLLDADRRRLIRDALGAGGPVPSPTSPPTSEPRLTAYSGLTPFSDAFIGPVVTSRPPRVNVVLPEFDPDGVFAGVKTAIEVAELLGRQTDRPVRLIELIPAMTDPTLRAIRSRRAETWLAAEFPGVTWTSLQREDLPAAAFGADDLWLATHWWTAHALDVAARSGFVDPADVLYLVQDYEPGFVGWSTDAAIAESTYWAGFSLLVNSDPVADHLRSLGHTIDGRVVFSPSFDSAALEAAAAAREPAAGPRRIFFYGRPSKPRNMFGLGVAALRLAAERLDADGISAEFVMAGEAGPDVDLGPAVLRNLGILRRDRYFELLSTIDVGLSLQASPHPSHPPFDLAVSGATVVVNDVDGRRNGFHPRIRAVRADPAALADAVVAAVSRPTTTGYLAVEAGVLGVPLSDAVTTAWSSRPSRADRAVHPVADVSRWSIRTSAPEGADGDGWGDTAFAVHLAAALGGRGLSVRVDRRGAPEQEVPDGVTVALRGLYRLRPVPGAFNVLWVISHPDLVTRDELDEYDLVFAASGSWASGVAGSTRTPVLPLLQATDPSVFHPGEPDGSLAADALFVGRTRNVFRPVVRDAIAAGRPPAIYGDGWEPFVDRRLIKAEYLSVERTALAYRSARAVLNDHWDDMREHGFLSNRLFDAVASGTRVITDRIDGIDHFGGAVRTYGSIDELRRLLTSSDGWPGPDELREIAARVAAQDSFAARAERLIREVDARRGASSADDDRR